ncbi:MAG: hypothetical protein U0168_18190 [Nannocystaceae bacterium]
MMRPRFPSALGLVAFAAACGTDERAEGDATASMTGLSLSASGAQTGIDADAGDDGDKLDVLGGDGGASMGGDSSTDAGCKKVDLLFVIDNSGSMADEQANLAASFPAFISGIRSELADTNGYNVGVISTDSYIGDLTCPPLQDGTLITRTAGIDASNMVCDPFDSGARYMIETDDLETKFGCVAKIGTSGDGNERTMGALSAALSPNLTGAGKCNEGFIRDDALLVVVIITDEEDDHEVDGCMQDPQPGSPMTRGMVPGRDRGQGRRRVQGRGALPGGPGRAAAVPRARQVQRRHRPAPRSRPASSSSPTCSPTTSSGPSASPTDRFPRGHRCHQERM